MKILSKKYGNTGLLVESVNSELDRMKTSTTNQMFVVFLEKIEMIHKYLDAVGRFDKIANAQTISKLESKLPQGQGQGQVRRNIRFFGRVQRDG